MSDKYEYIGMPRDEIDTPVLLVDLDALEHNIEKLAAHFPAAGQHNAARLCRGHQASPAVSKRAASSASRDDLPAQMTCWKAG